MEGGNKLPEGQQIMSAFVSSKTGLLERVHIYVSIGQRPRMETVAERLKWQTVAECLKWQTVAERLKWQRWLNA